MPNSCVQIIYLNGPSSSGKTTLAKSLQHALGDLFLHVGMDTIIDWMPEKVNDWTGGEASLGYSWKKSFDTSGNSIQELQIGPYAAKIAKTFQEVVITIELKFLPPYSPNLNLIERLWRFMHKKTTYNQYYEKFSEFCCLLLSFFNNIGDYAEELISLLFQKFYIIKNSQTQSA